MTKSEALEKIYSLTEEELFSLWSEFCRDKGSYGDGVFYNDDDFFDNMFPSNMGIARAVWYSGDNYRYCDKFVKFNAYGNLKSAAYLKDLADLEDDDFVKYFCNEYGYPLEEE